MAKVYIEVQSKANGYIGLVRALASKRLLDLCGHQDNPHPAPGKAVQCAEELARRNGHVIYDV